MEQLSMLGFAHGRTALPLLERLAVHPDDRAGLLAAVRASGCGEAVVLSTCSRTEVYAASCSSTSAALVGLLAARSGRPAAELAAHAEVRHGPAVVEHLFRVAAGLESRVVGEVDVQDQVRTALRAARAVGAVGPLLGDLFPAAVRCAAAVHTTTPLGGLGRSLARRAVELGLAAHRGASLEVLVVGSGRMATTAVQHLLGLGLRPRVAARSAVHAARLVGAGRTLPMAALAAGVRQAHLVVCATSATSDVVTAEHVGDARDRADRRLVVVDLSAPRNVDPAVAGLPGVRLVDLEQLGDADPDPALAAAAATAAVLVRSAAQRHAEALACGGIGPVLAAVRRQVEQRCARALALGGTEDLSRAARAAAGRELHLPVLAYRSAVAAGDEAALAALCRSLGIDEGALVPA